MPAESSADSSLSVSELRLRVEELEARLQSEREEAQHREAAVSEILQTINASAGNLTPVFDALLERAMHLCGAAFGILRLWDGSHFHSAASRGVPAAYAEFLAHNPQQPQPGSIGSRIVSGEPLVHVLDVAHEAIDSSHDPHRRALAELGGARTSLVVALTRDRRMLGAIQLYRRHVRAFSDKQMALLQNFAAQAVIAMENARLLGELRQRTDDLTDSLEYQTATSEVLKVISRSTEDLQPVLDAMVAAAIRLCAGQTGGIAVRRGDTIRFLATVGQTPEFERHLLTTSYPVDRSTAVGRVVLEKAVCHSADIAADPSYTRQEASTIGRQRAVLGVPLMRQGEAVGVIVVSRAEPEPFAERQIDLIKTFADQAVIAMENTRLLSELRQRTDDLTESLEYQTATSELLEVISRSTSDVQPVLDTMLASAARLCGAAFGAVAVRQGDVFRNVATLAYLPDVDRVVRRIELTPGRQTLVGRTLLAGQLVHISDLAAEPEYTVDAVVQVANLRTAIGVPLMREGEPIGVITLLRDRVDAFTERQIALIRTFADQAVIAMENARLLGELRQRTDDLTESLEYQTATSDLLEVISRSTADVQPVLDAMLASAGRLCGVQMGAVSVRKGDALRYVATIGVTERYDEFLRGTPQRIDRTTGAGRAVITKQVAYILDVQADPEYAMTETTTLGGFRSLLAVPLLRDDEAIGAITLGRSDSEPLTDRQIALVKTFSDQAVIAMENARLLGELRESLDQQTATSDVLKTISRTSVNLETVLDTLVETVARLCRADQAYMFRRRGELHHLGASHGLSDEALEFMRTHPFAPDEGTTSGRVVLRRQTIHIHDVLQDEAYSYSEGQKVAGFRTMLGIPLMAQAKIIGVFVVSRTRVEPFSDKEIALATGFADQAVIAIENARLFEELRDREAELRVTFDNMGDGVAMFDVEPRLVAWNRNFEEIIGLPQALLAERPSYGHYLRMLAERGEFGTENVEAELASRLEDTARELRLERTRADGSVIEVRRNAVPGGGFVLIYSDVTEQRRAEAAIRAARDDAEAALERQTATADILKVIASSPTDVQPVLEAVAKAAVQFCGTTDAVVHLKEGDEYVLVAHDGPLRGALGRRQPISENPHVFALLLEGRTIHFPEVQDLDAVKFASLRQIGAEVGFHAVLGAPLLREGTAIGSISLRRIEPGSFTPQQIDLLETFAAQAVIAIENVRLFTELREALEQQTATSDILRVISQSPTDFSPVLTAVAKAALKFCSARDAIVVLRDGDTWITAAHEGPIRALSVKRPLTRGTAPGRAILDGKVVQIVDLQSAEGDEFLEGREIAARLGFRAALAAPLLRDDVAIGAVSLRRPDAGAFTPNQVELLKSFAAQAVIAIENVRLFTELRESLERLKAAQANLIQAEKMASLGQLTAGIAHEIKNPLNFVNNFAGLSVELLDELKQAAVPVLVAMSENARAEFGETVDLIGSNLEKIAEHGKRADGIVKSMLAHSRGGTGDWQVSNINALVDEALNLAYHGARAQDQDFNVTLERDFASESKPIEVVPQDVTRVFLNLFGNGFYAAKKRQLSGAGNDYRPTLAVSTRDLGEAVEIRVRDNGTGIAPEVRAKLFQPFFTTKPTGEGTGLGLSISYDIVTQQHGGSIDVESEPGSFTEFTVRLPRRRRAA